MHILVTGAAGFIGSHLCRRLLADGHEVWGVDNFTPYYDVRLKRHRWDSLSGNHWHGYESDITDTHTLADIFAKARPERVFHLAAQAGVRYSLEAPRTYLDTNVMGTFNVIEQCVIHDVDHLIFASTSSAYGAREDTPFRERDASSHPVSLYAATKLAGEMIAHSQSHLHGLPMTGLRFFTVYGPEGRPDMAPHLFTDAILAGRPINVFNHGEMSRDFTYIDDLIEAVTQVADVIPTRGAPISDLDSLSPVAPYRIVNIGQSEPVRLMDFIKSIEIAAGKSAQINFMDMQKGDVTTTHADPTLLRQLTGYHPTTSVTEGVAQFVEWYRNYQS